MSSVCEALPSAPLRLRRHDLAWLRPETFPDADGDDPGGVWLAEWVRAGGPLVVARQEGGDDVVRVRLGAVLPPRLGRERRAVEARAEDVARVAPPLSTGAVGAALPAATRDALDDCNRALEALGARLGVYGSIAWETLTGEPYRRAGSDVDLICDLDDPATLPGCLDALARAAERSPLRLDGEVRFPAGAAVAWRELQATDLKAGARVLAKHSGGVALVELEALRCAPSLWSAA